MVSPKKKIYLVFTFLIFGLSCSGIKTTLNNSHYQNEITLHLSASEWNIRGRINIETNEGFNSTNGVTMGNGSVDSPYIIENWIINTTTIKGSCPGIYIQNTTAHVIIRNCILIDNAYGVLLENTKNVAIENNTMKFNTDSIFIRNSTNIIILDNTFHVQSVRGIRLIDSHNTIAENNIIEQGYYGIKLSNSTNNTFKTNRISNQKNAGFSLDNLSHNNTIANMHLFDNQYGIELFSGDLNNVVNNTIFSNSRTGIYLLSSDNNLITRNNVTKNGDFGIILWFSNNNIISYNDFRNNNQSWRAEFNSTGNEFIGNVNSFKDKINEIPYPVFFGMLVSVELICYFLVIRPKERKKKSSLTLKSVVEG